VPDDDDDGGSAKNLHVCKFFDLTSSWYIYIYIFCGGMI
jgi:hypothetical protein